MDFAHSDMQAMLLDSAERLLSADAGVDYWRAQRAAALGFDEGRWAQLAELGWLALGVPEAAGGLGGTIEDSALLNVALGRALATEPYVSTAVLAAHLLATAGDGADAEAALGAIVEGRLRVALAHHETGADAASATVRATVAVRTDGGFRIDGRKSLAFDAPSAGLLIVSARIDGEEGTALFLVDPAIAGVSLEPYPLIDGTRAADLLFAGVELSASALLAGSNIGAALLDEAIARANIALMAQAVGSMEACVALCGDYARERQQFGAPIGSFQAIQHILADMLVASHQARSMLYHAIAGASKPAAERDAALSAARIVIGEAGQLVSRSGIQVHGGYGLTDEYAISHHFRRLMSLERQYGDVARHLERFGDAIFA